MIVKQASKQAATSSSSFRFLNFASPQLCFATMLAMEEPLLLSYLTTPRFCRWVTCQKEWLSTSPSYDGQEEKDWYSDFRYAGRLRKRMFEMPFCKGEHATLRHLVSEISLSLRSCLCSVHGEERGAKGQANGGLAKAVWWHGIYCIEG